MTEHNPQPNPQAQPRPQTQPRLHPQTAAQKLYHAENTCADLLVALVRADIILPSVRVDPMAYGDEDPKPLIELGRCTVDTAHRLTAVLRKAQV
jgi:hypothetical protein